MKCMLLRSNAALTTGTASTRRAHSRVFLWGYRSPPGSQGRTAGCTPEARPKRRKGTCSRASFIRMLSTALRGKGGRSCCQGQDSGVSWGAVGLQKRQSVGWSCQREADAAGLKVKEGSWNFAATLLPHTSTYTPSPTSRPHLLVYEVSRTLLPAATSACTMATMVVVLPAPGMPSTSA